jgi:hypothetical protein
MLLPFLALMLLGGQMLEETHSDRYLGSRGMFNLHGAGVIRCMAHARRRDGAERECV